MNENEYLEQRVNDQINWYDTKSSKNKKCHYTFKVTEIICAASIPLLSQINSVDIIIIGILGLIVAIAATLSGVFKFQENWINYRTIAETLKHHKMLFLTRSFPYSDEGSFEEFVKNIESSISKEHSNWVDISRKKDSN